VETAPIEHPTSPKPDEVLFQLATDWPEPRTAVVTTAGDLDLHTAGDLRQALLDAVEEGAEIVVVDLEGTTFVDSMALGVLVGAMRRLAERGGELRIACADQGVKRVFEITMLDRVFAFSPSREAALTQPASAG
jgi:anti-sigma B factor antagonist